MKRLLPLGIVGFLAIRGVTAAQPACDSYPWTITATSSGGGSAQISVCGRFTGCRPHSPSFQVSGSRIDVTFEAGLLPGCQCPTVEGSIGESVLVTSLPPGTYSVHVTLLYCENPIPEGDTSVVVGGGSPVGVPALDPRGAAVMVALMAVVAAWRLR
jgi:hypothetical protein